MSETWITMNRRKCKFKGVFLTVLRLLIRAEELEKFLFTATKNGTYYVSEMECVHLQYFDGIAENHKNQKPASWFRALPSHYFLNQLLKCLKESATRLFMVDNHYILQDTIIHTEYWSMAGYKRTQLRHLPEKLQSLQIYYSIVTEHWGGCTIITSRRALLQCSNKHKIMLFPNYIAVVPLHVNFS